jgi:3D (Asp-Asp-Asp) domain-containing protein
MRFTVGRKELKVMAKVSTLRLINRKIAFFVVCLVPVYVVNHFAAFKPASKPLFSKPAVFQNVVFGTYPDVPISVTGDIPVTEFKRGRVLAFGGTEFPGLRFSAIPGEGYFAVRAWNNFSFDTVIGQITLPGAELSVFHVSGEFRVARLTPDNIHRSTPFMGNTTATVPAVDDSGKCFYLTVKVTAYCKYACCCGDSADGITATGIDADRKGIAVAADKRNRVVNLGDRLDIPQYGTWIAVDDVGGKVGAGQVDIRVPTHAFAKSLGVRYLRVRVWRKAE